MAASGWLQIIVTLLAIFLLSIPDGPLHGPDCHGPEDKVRPVLRSDRQRHLFPHRPQGHKPGDDVEGLHFPHAGDQHGHGADHLCDFSFQDLLPLNQLGFPGMEPFQAFNTAVSFITNTNWQSYGGETTLSNFSQMSGDHLPDVHLGDDRLRRRDGVDSRLHRQKRRRRSRQFLSRLHPLHHARSDPDLLRGRIGDDRARRGSDLGCER